MIKIGDLKKLGLSLELDLGDVVEEIKGQPMVVEFGWRKVDDSSCLLTGINIDLKSVHGGQVSYLPVKNAYWELWSHWRPSIDWLSLQVIDKVLYVDNTTEFGGDVTTETPEEAEAFNKMKPYEFDEHVSGEKPVFTQAMYDAGELPPVGSIATFDASEDSEFYYDYDKGLCDGGEVEIIAHFHTKFALVAAFLYSEPNGKVVSQSVAANFKPLDTRTPKQKAVDEMISDSGWSGGAISDAFGKLYDKGYRK